MWLEGDYEAALAVQMERQLTCGGCGHPRDEVWVYDQDRQAEQEAAYRAKIGRRLCVACKVGQRDQADWHSELQQMSEGRRRALEHGWHWTFEDAEVTGG